MGLSFLLNLFFFVSGINRHLSLLLASGVMASSYYISNHLINLNYNVWVYIEWMVYDLVTVFTIYILHRLINVKMCLAVYYVFFGLSINSTLFFIMFFDIYILGSTSSSWFWHLYTIIVNSVDVLMVAVLILNRDFLLLKRLKFLYKDE